MRFLILSWYNCILFMIALKNDEQFFFFHESWNGVNAIYYSEDQKYFQVCQ